MSTTEIFNYVNKSIVGASSIVAGSTWLPQSTLQAVGTTNLSGNVFINAGTIIPPNPFTSSSAQGGYSVTALEGTSTAWQVFNQNVSSFWEVTSNYTSGSYTGTYSNIIDSATSTQYNGAYVQLTCPNSIVLQYYTLVSRFGYETTRSPLSWRVFGSTNGTTWFTVDSQTSISNWSAPQVIKTFYVTTTPTAYRYFALLVQSVQSLTVLDVSMWNLYTTPATPGLSVISGNVVIYQGGGLSVGTQNLGSNIALFSNIGGGSNVVVINANAWVGIGTTNPTNSLQVNGNALFSTDTFAVPFATVGTLGVLSGATIGPSSTTLGSNLLVLSNASGGSNVTIFTGNTVGISNLAPATTLSVGGTISALGNVVTSNYGTCPPLTFRQGVSAAGWSQAGTTNVPLGIGSVNMQCGAAVCSSGTVTVNFPLSYASNSLVMLTATGTGNGNLWVSSNTTSSFTVTANTPTQTFNWLCLGI